MKRLAAVMSMVTTLALGLAASGCSGEPSLWVKPQRLADPAGSSPADLAELPELRVEYGGCATVRLGAQDELECIYEPGAQLRLWVMHEDGQQPVFAMEGDGAWSMGEPYVLPEELGQGYRLELTETGLRAVTVELPQRPKWRLALRAVGELSETERAEMDRLRKRFLRLEKKLATPEPEVVPELGVVPTIRVLLREMVDRGQLWNAIRSGTATAYQLTWRAGRPDIAYELLAELDQMLEHRLPSFERAYPLGGAVLSTFVGHTLRRRGLLVEAASEYRDATRLVRRTDDLVHVLDAMAPYALVLAELGYFEAAAYWSAEVRELAVQHSRPYELAQILVMIAKVGLRLREARHVYDDPAPRLEEVKQIYGKDGPLANKYRKPFDAILSRAELALLENNPRGALAELRPYRGKQLSADRAARMEELWLKSKLLQKADVGSLRADLRRLQDYAEDAVGPEFRWKAAVLEGQVFEVLGDVEQALDAYSRAENLLDRLLPMAALGLPGDFAAVRHHGSTERLVSLLSRRGQLEQVVCAIRRSRARVGQMALLHRRVDESLREELLEPIEGYTIALLAYEELLEESTTLAAPAYERARLLAAQRRQDLERQALEILSSYSAYDQSFGCEKLSPREPGELLLVLYSDDSDLNILVQDDQGVSQYPKLRGYFDGTMRNEDWQSDLMLHPLRTRIMQASRIRVLASGRAHEIPVHALPWSAEPHDRDDERQPLVSYVPVVYGLDLPLVSRDVGDEVGVSRALVLAEAQAESAKSELVEVASLLRNAGWNVAELTTGEREPGAVRELLQQMDHFHYAGHSYYDEGLDGKSMWGTTTGNVRVRRWPPYSGGAAIEPSFLPLGEYGKLTVSDILMMEHVPRSVVLMGCATGIIDERTARGGFSLATAFLGAGAQAVVASTHEIKGSEAAILGRALYAGLNSNSSEDPGLWMRRAVQFVTEQHQMDLDIANYRVYVP